MTRYLLFLLLSGCAAISTTPPPTDWPKLATTIHAVSSKEMRDVCQPYMPFGSIAEACALWNFDAKTCDIWIDRETQSGLEHEKLHCLGYDHAGGTTLADAWASYKGRKWK